jgi:hypothetical protein
MHPQTIVSQDRDWLDYLGAVVGSIGLVVVTAYTILTYRLLRTTREALAETRRSNDATEKSNEIAERSLELGRRAWVVIDIEQPDESIIQLTIKNNGGTPATDLRVKYHLAFEPNTTDVPDYFSAKGHELSMAFIGAGGVVFLTPWPVQMQIEKIQRFARQEEGTFYCYCEVAYKDIFNKMRTTAMCWHYVFIKTGESNGEFRWALEPKHTRME